MSIQRILIFRAGAVGDFVVTLPAIASLRAAYHGASIDLVGYPDRAILAQTFVNRIHDVDAAHWSALFARGSDLSLVEPIIGETDLAIAYMNDPDDLVIENLTRCGVRRTLFHPPRPDEKGDTHAVDHLLKPLSTLGIPAISTIPTITIDERSFQSARSILEKAGVDRSYAAFHAGAGGQPKQWDAGAFAPVAQTLWQDRELAVVVTSGPADGTLAEEIAHLASTHVVPLHPVDLPTLCALYAQAEIYLGCDTGPSHIAAATATPSVVLFGPSPSAVWAPRGPNVRVIEAPGGSMSSLDPKTVTEAMSGLLHKT